MDTIDLHIHTTASDGTDAPARAVELAGALGLRAVGITDHDTVSGVAEAVAAGERLGVEVVPGIEISSDYRDNTVHILGYFIDPAAPALDRMMNWAEEQRRERNQKMAEMLSADGFDISMEALEEEFPGAVLGRPHFAEHLVHRGYVSSVQEGFTRYLSMRGKYFIPKRRIPLAEAGAVIRAAGGVAVVAHPLQYRYPLEEVTAMLQYAREAGVGCVECYYSNHTVEEQQWLLDRAEALGMGVTGGSDYHGTRKPAIALGSGKGTLAVPYSVLEDLKNLV